MDNLSTRHINSFYTIHALTFYYQASEWAQLSAAQRLSVKSQYAAAGISLIVSAFGSTEQPTTNGADPIGTANTMAAWVKQFDLDGIDVDYEVYIFIHVPFTLVP